MELLARHPVLSTRDLHEARDAVGRELCPHALDIIEDPRRFHARLNVARLGAVSLHYLRYGAGVRITHQHVDDTYGLLVPRTGSTSITRASETVTSCGATAAIIQPGDETTKVLGAGSDRLLVFFERSVMATTLAQLLGRAVSRPLDFDLAIDLGGPRGRGLSELLDLVCRDLEATTRLATHPLALRHLQQLLVTELLLVARHARSEQLHEDTGPAAAPSHVRRAVEMIESHAHEPLTVEVIAGAIGVGVRALQHGFRRQLNTTPMSYLRKVRLAYAHAELRAATSDETSVSEVATRWGFLHLGRFARAYRAAYGELPSATLSG